MNETANAEILKNIRVVLARPIYGGNIGAVCRAMSNMGLSDLALVAPQPFDMNEALKMACWASDILKSRKEFPDLHAAVADCSRIFGTTARGGLYRAHVRTPRESAPLILQAASSGKVALLFGPEDDGLANKELEVCTNLIRIPSSERYPSLNLAQAVMICCYELFVASGAFEPPAERSPEARAELKERMFAFWEKALLGIGFMNRDKALHMMLGLRRALARGALTEDDVKILMGIARQTDWCAAELRKCHENTPEPAARRRRSEPATGRRRKKNPKPKPA